MSDKILDVHSIEFDCFKASPGARFYCIENLCGVYQIKNDITGDLYIGSSHKIRNRVLYHFSRLRSNKHNNPYLQKAYNKYGPYSFSASILEICEKGSLLETEQRWLDEISPAYNLVLVVGSNFMFGRHHSEETKRKIGEKTKSRVTKEFIDAFVARSRGNTYGKKNKGKKFGSPTEEVKRKRKLTFSRSYNENPEHFSKSKNHKEKIAQAQRTYPIILENMDLCCISEFYALSCFCDDNNLSYHQMWKLTKGQINSYKGWVLCQR